MLKTFVVLIVAVTCRVFALDADSPKGFEDLIEHLVESEEPKEVRVQAGKPYTVVVHSGRVRKLMKARYDMEDLKKLDELLKKSSEILVNEKGFVTQPLGSQASVVDVWESLWAYMALKATGHPDAKRVLKGLLDDFSSQTQLERLGAVIEKPMLLKTNPSMVAHLRFNGESADFQDVPNDLADGKIGQFQNHNKGALGLLLDLSVRALATGELLTADLTETNFMALSRLVVYFSRVKFHEDMDYGLWSSKSELQLSSVALVTSALEYLESIMGKKTKPEAFTVWLSRARLDKSIKALKPAQYLSLASLRSQVNLGYKSIRKVLGKIEPNLANLSLIFPAQLKRLNSNQKISVLKSVQELVGRVGVKRFRGDEFESGNFWFLQEGEPALAIPDTEAQWALDSWLSICYSFIEADQLRFFNRALGQFTSESPLAANGQSVPAMTLPQLYAIVALNHSQFFVPSARTPSVWSKASYILARSKLLMK